jgi:hypothetical protein
MQAFNPLLGGAPQVTGNHDPDLAAVSATARIVDGTPARVAALALAAAAGLYALRLSGLEFNIGIK